LAAPGPEQGVAGEAPGHTATAETPTRAVEPVGDNGDAAMPPVSVSDAGGGRVRIEAHDASLVQVLAALQDSRLIEFNAADALSGIITGTYIGTLPQVLTRILNGHDYFLRVTASGTELHAVKASGDSKAGSRNGVSSNIDAEVAPAPAPEPALSLLPPSPVPREQVRVAPRVTPSPAAKARARAHSSVKTP
jgi:hypothetical protein